MWSRAQLKDKAKFALKHNYWKAVFVSFIVTALIGGTAYTVSYDIGEEMMYEILDMEDQSVKNDLEYSNQYEDNDNSEDYWDGYYDGYFGSDDESLSSDYADGYNDGLLDKAEAGNDDTFDFENESPAYIAGFTFGIILMIMLLFIIVLAIDLVWSTFILNPVQVGCNRFFFKTLNQKAEVKEVAFAFDNNYKNVIKISFFKNLYTLLWSLLFIIPGIVKSYEYRMISYLLAENPNLTKQQAFAISKQMMNGNKWKAFVLDLSFLGWDLLSVCTMGILETFYVGPYKNLTNAALYEELSLINGRPAFAVQQPNMGNPFFQGQPVQQAYTAQGMNPYAQPVQNDVPAPIMNQSEEISQEVTEE